MSASTPPLGESRFLGLVEAHKGILYKVARLYAWSPAERDDLTQETVVHLWRAFPRFDESLRFSTWMYRIALNVAISWRRRERTQTQHLVADGETLLQEARVPERAADETDGEDLALLYACIARYPELDRALLMLYLDDQSQADIAAVLGLTPTNVSTKLGRLKQRLRDDFRAAGHRLE